MDSFKTAEAVTRFLRGKDSSPQDVCGAVSRLFSGEIPVYLPNHTHFVFELVCDRLNDFNGKNFKAWKLCADVWDLLATTWTLLGENPLDREVRAKSFRRVKFVAIVSSVLESCGQNYDEPLLTAMFKCVNVVMSTGYLDVDEYNAVGLLKSYVDLVLVIETKPTDPAVVNSWSAQIADIFSILHLAVSYKPTKKALARFFEQPLPVILNVLAHRNIEPLAATYDMLQGQFAFYCFGTESVSSLISHVEATVTSSQLTPAGAEYLFQEVITNLASVDIAVCEGVYVKITATFTALAEKLLAVLAKVNRTLSSSFLAQIYESEMAKPSQNWKLVGYLVTLDPDLALAKWTDVVDATSTRPKEESVMLADSLARGFIKARNFFEFLQEVYPSAYKKSTKVWSDEEVISVLSPKVNELSGNQISELISHFLKSQDRPSLLIIVQGLLQCPLAKQKAAESLFSDYSFCQPGWSDVAYFVLCIYGEKILESQPDILLKVESKGKSSNYDVYVKFRVAELTADLSLVDVKEVKKLLLKLNANALVLFAQRWLVLIDQFPEIHSALFEKLLKHLEKDQMIAYFTGLSDIIYELPGFMTGFLKALKQNPIAYRDELLCCFPASIFRKYFSFYIGSIAKSAIEDPTDLIPRQALNHILQEPTLSSDLEKNLDTLQKILGTTNPENLEVSLDIARSIWSAHWSNFNDTASSKYVVDAFNTCTKSMKKPLNGDLALAQVILSTPLSKSNDQIKQLHQDLSKAFVSAVKKLKLSLDEQLDALSGIPLDGSSSVRSLIGSFAKEVGSKVLTSRTQARLFALVAKSGLQTEANSLFLASLFVAVSEQIKDDNETQFMLKQLGSFFKNLPNEIYVRTYRHVLFSLENAPPSYVPHLIDLLAILAPHLSKEHQKEHTELFVATISAVSLQKHLAENSASLLRFLSTITLMLTDHIWVCTQFSIELVLGLGDAIANGLSKCESREAVYISVLQLVSYVVLFHRYRLSSRYHLIIGVTSRLMLPLASKAALENSASAASSYSRLLTALSEPLVHGSTKESDSLTSQAATYKKVLRKHAHVLVVSYVHLQLTESLTSDVNEAILPGVYSVLGLLSRVELQLINQCLDTLGKAYFKTLYSGYRDHGKWKDQ